MKRTVEISSRNQPVIDFYKSYNNAEFNVLSSNLLCQYQLFLKQKNLDLLPLLECLKSYDFSLPKLLVVMSQNFDILPQDKLSEMNNSIITDEIVDNTGVKQTRKKSVQNTEKKQYSKPEVSFFNENDDVLLELQHQGYESVRTNNVTPVSQPAYPAHQKSQQVEKNTQYNPYIQPEAFAVPNPSQYSNQNQHSNPEPAFEKKSEPKQSRPVSRRFTLAEMGLDLSD